MNRNEIQDYLQNIKLPRRFNIELKGNYLITKREILYLSGNIVFNGFDVVRSYDIKNGKEK